jgi:hypothetical protein
MFSLGSLFSLLVAIANVLCNAMLFSKHIMYHCVQQMMFLGEYGFMFHGYHPVINTLAKGLGTCLNHRYVYKCFSYNFLNSRCNLICFCIYTLGEYALI